MGSPSSSLARYSSPAHSATTGAPDRASRATSARSGSLADRSLACISGNPPPSTRAPVPAGSAASRSGSTVTTSAPAAVSNSIVSV